MPKDVERRLKRTAARRGYGRRRTAAYVYGTLSKLKRRGKR